MAHQPMLLPDPSERPFLPEGSFAPARGPEWLEEASGNDPRVDAAACRDAEIRSILAVPILDQQELLGVLEVFASRTKAFDDTDVYAVQALSRRIVENLRRADDVGSSVDVASSVEEKSEEQRPYQEPVSPLAALSPVSEPSRREPDPVPKLTHEDQKDEH